MSGRWPAVAEPSAPGAVGLAPVSENWRGFSTHEVAEVPVAHGRSVVDLHWHLVAMGRSRRHFHLPTGDLIDRAVTVHVGGREVLTLDPADTLVHLCVNVGLDGARRLRGLIDVDTVIRSGRVDVEEFVERAGRARAGRLAAAVLQRSQTLLRTPLPAGLLGRLSPGRAWLLANSVVDHGGALGRRPSAGVSPGLLLASGRESGAATVASFGRSLWRMMTAAMGRPALTEPGGELDWQRKPPPDRLESHRREYLEWVEQQ